MLDRETGAFELAREFALQMTAVPTFFSGESAHSSGEMSLGGAIGEEDPAPAATSAVRAVDPLNGTRVWEFLVTPKSMSGLLATAGSLVFGGSSHRGRGRDRRLQPQVNEALA